jgi:hypothetical protein
MTRTDNARHQGKDSKSGETGCEPVEITHMQDHSTLKISHQQDPDLNPGSKTGTNISFFPDLNPGSNVGKSANRKVYMCMQRMYIHAKRSKNDRIHTSIPD